MIDAVPLQVSVRASTVLDAAAEIGGLAVVAAAVAGGLAITYRWYARERVSNPPAVLVALATVALLLNAMTALGEVMYGATTLSVKAAAFNVSALAAGTVAALVGITVGDHLAKTVLGGTDQVALDDSVSRVVRAVGRVITVELPAEIDDVPGYDPVDAETKATLEAKTFVFPRGLTVQELRDRLTRRLREDYRVGHVDIEIDDDGAVTHLGLGARAAGIGPTLPPESAAMAVRADPAYAASAGDLVQVWERDPKRRLLNAEVRGTAGEIVTLAIDAADASKLSSEERYKLVTLPIEERDDRELTELLRAADETLGVVEIADGSSLAGVPVGALAVTVVAIHAGGPDDRIEALPASDRVLSGGDSVYVIARPDAIRRIESAGTVESVGEGASASSTISDVRASHPVESAQPVDDAGSVDEQSTTGSGEGATETDGEQRQGPSGTADPASDSGDDEPEPIESAGTDGVTEQSPTGGNKSDDQSAQGGTSMSEHSDETGGVTEETPEATGETTEDTGKRTGDTGDAVDKPNGDERA
ncbi:TrkA-C domain-containing protein [Halorhabdus tiamatea SARL4B]|uniref:TrkA-C domain-containing protein n=1 Tax=Halorhabdus tiamatea SARL4B TaxID=1033806 RepID=F7PHQ6_9EURY|nr:hypothetical protein [Halorhabdus tiamatea]ERJ06900.1 TrkA-C domain-containing protein [Halorhabdus tiamatea SARL4B]CCQ32396.1 conserved hypothetical protein containing TrkA-C domain [Halorhabdus tiamatea SARL4B]